MFRTKLQWGKPPCNWSHASVTASPVNGVPAQALEDAKAELAAKTVWLQSLEEENRKFSKENRKKTEDNKALMRERSAQDEKISRLQEENRRTLDILREKNDKENRDALEFLRRSLQGERFKTIADLNKQAKENVTEIITAKYSEFKARFSELAMQGRVDDLERQLNLERERVNDLKHSRAMGDRTIRELEKDIERLRAGNVRLSQLTWENQRLEERPEWDATLDSICSLSRSFVPVCEDLTWAELFYHLYPMESTNKGISRFIDLLGEADQRVWYCLDNVYHNDHLHEASEPRDESCPFYGRYAEPCVRMSIKGGVGKPTLRFRLVKPIEP